MKKYIFFIIGCLALASALSCGSPANQNSSDSTQESSQESIDSGLEITAVIPDTYPESLACYTVDYTDLDEAAIVKAFLPDDPVKTITNENEAVWESANGAAVLNILFQTDTIRENRIIYTGYDSKEERLAADKNNERSFIERIIKEKDVYRGLTKYANERLMPYDRNSETASQYKNTVQASFDSLCKDGQLPQIAIRSISFLDKETMQDNLKIYNDVIKLLNPNSQIEEYTYTDKDEVFYVAGQECIDGIPITNSLWYREKTGPAPTVFVNIRAMFTSDVKLRWLSAGPFFSVSDKKEAKTISSPLEAIQAYESLYGAGGLLKGTSLISVELNYAVMQRGEVMIAVPVWLLTVMKETPAPDGGFFPKYDVFAMDAETLEIYKN